VNRWHYQQAVRCLHRGGVIAYPTEAVYGLGCDPWDRSAVERLLTLKKRRWQQGLILIAANYAQLEPFLLPLSPRLRQRVFATWPGPVTWLLPAQPDMPRWLCGQHHTLAVRITAHPQAAALCRAWDGALVSTSANQTRHRPARSALQVRLAFPQGIDYLLPGSLGGQSRPSEIRDGHSGQVLRAGG